jgi:hypothetical protein
MDRLEAKWLYYDGRRENDQAAKIRLQINELITKARREHGLV